MRFPTPGVLEGLLSNQRPLEVSECSGPAQGLTGYRSGRGFSCRLLGCFWLLQQLWSLGDQGRAGLGNVTLLPPLKHLHSRAVSPGVNAVLSTTGSQKEAWAGLRGPCFPLFAGSVTGTLLPSSHGGTSSYSLSVDPLTSLLDGLFPSSPPASPASPHHLPSTAPCLQRPKPRLMPPSPFSFL